MPVGFERHRLPAYFDQIIQGFDWLWFSAGPAQFDGRRTDSFDWILLCAKWSLDWPQHSSLPSPSSYFVDRGMERSTCSRINCCRSNQFHVAVSSIGFHRHQFSHHPTTSASSHACRQRHHWLLERSSHPTRRWSCSAAESISLMLSLIFY